MNKPSFPLTALAAGLAVTLAACSTLPEPDPAMDEARAAHDSARDSPLVATYAAVEYRRADEAYRRAEAAWLNRQDRAEVDHLAYIAQRRADIALETARQKSAEAAIANANVERDRIRLEARTREAQIARDDARVAALQADATRRAAVEAQQQAAIADQQAQASRAQAAAAQEQAIATQQQLAESDARARALSVTLSDLQTRMTDHGLVITLGDVLFETGSARLREPGVRAVQRLALFMKQYPERRVAIEGYTDNVGSDGFNQELSERRANAVRIALLETGIAPERISAHGFGKSYPVANNGDATGRQLNRRVEVVVSDEAGRIPRRPG